MAPRPRASTIIEFQPPVDGSTILGAVNRVARGYREYTALPDPAEQTGVLRSIAGHPRVTEELLIKAPEGGLLNMSERYHRIAVTSGVLSVRLTKNQKIRLQRPVDVGSQEAVELLGRRIQADLAP